MDQAVAVMVANKNYQQVQEFVEKLELLKKETAEKIVDDLFVYLDEIIECQSTHYSEIAKDHLRAGVEALLSGCDWYFK